MLVPGSDPKVFHYALQGLKNGDFSWLEPAFIPDETGKALIVRWHGEGRFEDHPAELAEAMTCACFLGKLEVAELWMRAGVPLSGGSGTGMNAFHWAANRGHLEIVRFLIDHKAPFDPRTRYGGNVLDTAVWSAMNEPKPDHIPIIDALLAAGRL